MSRLSDMNPILRSKHNIQEKFNNIVEEKCLILECIEDMISKAESAVENMLNENDRMKFLTAYRSVNRYLENCAEKLLEVRIILFDKEECDSSTCYSIKTSPSLLSVDDRSVTNESYSLLNHHSKIPETNVKFIPPSGSVSNVGERNAELADFTEVKDAIAENKYLTSQDKLCKPSTSLHDATNVSVNKDNSAKINSVASSYFSPTSSYHSFSSLPSSPITPNKSDPQPLNLCHRLSRPELPTKAVTSMHTAGSNSSFNIHHSRTSVTPPKCPQNSPSYENIKPIMPRYKADSNSPVNTDSNGSNISSPCQESLSSDESSKPIMQEHKMNDSLPVITDSKRMDLPPSTSSQGAHSGKNFTPVISMHDIDSKKVYSRTDTSPSSSDADFKPEISSSKIDSKQLVGTTCSDKKPQNLCSDEDAKTESLLSDCDGRQNLQFCLKRNSPKGASSASVAHKSVIPPYQIEVSVNVTFVENPSSFWLQPNKEQFQELFDQLRAVQLKESPSCFTKERHYLAPYGSEDGLHRVKLIEEPSPDGLAVVQYIDYGNRESISTTSLKSLAPQLTTFPAQAVHCFLIGVKSEEKETYSFAKLFEESSDSDSVFAVFSPPESEKYPVHLIIKSVASPHSLDVAKHISRHQRYSSASPLEATKHISKHQGESSTSSFEAKINKEAFHQPEKDPGNSSDTFSFALNQEIKVEERSENTTDEEIFEGEKDLHNKGASAFFNGWPEKGKMNFSCEPESNSSSSNSSSAKSSRNENNGSCEDENWDVEVPEPEIVLLQNNSVPVMVSVIINPKQFYVHIVSEKSCELDNLSEQLNNYYNKSCQRTSVKSLKVGSYCACPFSSNQEWYRVLILEILEDSNSRKLPSKNSLDVVVQYIDYGNKERVSSKDLRPLPQFLAYYPAFAVRCSLAHVQPPLEEGNNSSEIHWPKKTIERFKELTGFEKCFTAQFLSALDIRSEPEVILWNSEETSVNDILIQEGFACKDFSDEESDFEKSNGDSESIDGLVKGWNPMADDFLNERNLYELDPDDPEIAFTGYKAKDEKYICKFFSRGERCHRGERCPYKHVRTEGATTLDKEEVFSYDLSIDLPQVGTCVLVQVSAVFNPIHFYVIFPYGTVAVDDTNILAYSERENLDKFVKSMCMFYNTTKVKKSLTVHALGKIVAAKSRSDNQWYRARVLDTAEKLTKVFFVDFGNCEWVPHYDLEEIDTKFMDFPFQAAECRLANLQIKRKADPELKTALWDMFQKFTENKIVLAEIIGHVQSVLLVKLYCVTATNDISINDELIVRGFAIPED